nr:MAG TPA: hypothetical protein [Caudoviricetes sp.]
MLHLHRDNLYSKVSNRGRLLMLRAVYVLSRPGWFFFELIRTFHYKVA